MRATIKSLAFAQNFSLMEAGRPEPRNSVLFLWELAVEIEIQFEHVDTRFPENAQLALLSMFVDETLGLICRNATLFRHSRNLKLGGCGRNIRIESGGRCCYQVDGQRLARVLHVVRAAVGCS